MPVSPVESVMMRDANPSGSMVGDPVGRAVRVGALDTVGKAVVGRRVGG